MGKTKQEVREDAVSVREVYDLIERVRTEMNRRIDSVDTKVEGVSNQVSSINGSMKSTSFFISTAIGVFFFVINLVAGRK